MMAAHSRISKNIKQWPLNISVSFHLEFLKSFPTDWFERVLEWAPTASSSSRHRYSLLGGYTKGVINVQTGLFGEEQTTFGKLMNWLPIETGGA